MSKPRVVIVGGMHFNVPAEFFEHFELVKHIEQATNRLNQLPRCDYVFAISDWVSHGMVKAIKRETGLPIIWLRKGWNAMKAELQKRGLVPPDVNLATALPELFREMKKKLPDNSTPPEPPAPAPAKEEIATVGIPVEELWKKYGKIAISCVRSVMKQGEKISETDLLGFLAMEGGVGLPTGDMKSLLPELQIRGVLSSTPDGRWMLMSTEDVAYDSDVAEKKYVPVSRRRAAQAELIRALPIGPYPSRQAISNELKKYQEFWVDGKPLGDEAFRRIMLVAVALNVIEEQHGKWYVDHSDAVKLTEVAHA